jgi:predicted small lipoprotein YifL
MPFQRIRGRQVFRLIAALALGAMLAGCGKCGPWFGPYAGAGSDVPTSCHSDAPPPR